MAIDIKLFDQRFSVQDCYDVEQLYASICSEKKKMVDYIDQMKHHYLIKTISRGFDENKMLYHLSLVITWQIKNHKSEAFRVLTEQYDKYFQSLEKRNQDELMKKVKADLSRSKADLKSYLPSIGPHKIMNEIINSIDEGDILNNFDYQYNDDRDESSNPDNINTLFNVIQLLESDSLPFIERFKQYMIHKMISEIVVKHRNRDDIINLLTDPDQFVTESRDCSNSQILSSVQNAREDFFKYIDIRSKVINQKIKIDGLIKKLTNYIKMDEACFDKSHKGFFRKEFHLDQPYKLTNLDSCSFASGVSLYCDNLECLAISLKPVASVKRKSLWRNYNLLLLLSIGLGVIGYQSFTNVFLSQVSAWIGAYAFGKVIASYVHYVRHNIAKHRSQFSKMGNLTKLFKIFKISVVSFLTQFRAGRIAYTGSSYHNPKLDMVNNPSFQNILPNGLMHPTFMIDLAMILVSCTILNAVPGLSMMSQLLVITLPAALASNIVATIIPRKMGIPAPGKVSAPKAKSSFKKMSYQGVQRLGLIADNIDSHPPLSP